MIFRCLCRKVKNKIDEDVSGEVEKYMFESILSSGAALFLPVKRECYIHTTCF